MLSYLIVLVGGLCLTTDGLMAPPVSAAPTSAPPKAVENGPPVDANGDRYLWPRFEKGQRVILRETKQRGEHGGREVTMRVTIDVLDRKNDEVVLRWKVDQIETTTPVPEGMKEFVTRDLRRFETAVLELVVKEGVGLVAVRNWEQAAAELVANLERDLGPAAEDRERTQRSTEWLKQILSERKRAEPMLLESVRWYFEGGYVPLAPGMAVVDQVSDPGPFLPGEPAMVKCERRRECDRADAAAAHLRTLSTQLTFDPAELKAAFASWLASLDITTGTEKESPAIESCEAKVVHRWTLDANRGWPSAVECTKEQTVNGRSIRNKIRWELIEGPMPTPAEAPAADKPGGNR